MMDVKKAIEYEKEYIACRLKGEYPYHFIDKVRECGFDSIEQFKEEKRNYEFDQLEFDYEETNQVDCLNRVFDTIDNKKVRVLFATTDNTFVFAGDNSDYNEDYCKANNIPIYPIKTHGGAIVSVKGDLSVGICVPESIGVDRTFILNKLKDVLKERLGDIEIDNNDILVNGKKVCGSASYKKNGMFMFVAHISFNNNKDLIDKICTKNKNNTNTKTPFKLECITDYDFRKGVLKWLRVHST